MAESNNNREYFSSEASVNRDTWKHASGSERVLRVRNAPNIYATALFDDANKTLNNVCIPPSTFYDRNLPKDLAVSRDSHHFFIPL